jgi:Flp pilus assembly protein TadB
MAIALRKELSGEWPLPVAGTLSIIFGVLLLLLAHVGVLALVMGFYALVFGFSLMALARRLRQLEQEIPAATVLSSRPNSARPTETSTRSSSRV